MIFKLLGQFQFSGDASPPTGNALRLLVVLLLNRNRYVPKDTLKRLVWGPGRHPDYQLHNLVAELRAVLGKIGRGNDLLNRRDFGYQLRVAPGDVDVDLFLAAAQRAETAATENRIDDESRALRAALDLWRGDNPLADIPGAPLSPRTVKGWISRRRAVAARFFEIELARGNQEQIRDELSQIFRANRTDPNLAAQLMVTLHRCGQPAAEVAPIYAEHERALRIQSGAVSGPLQKLRLAIARGDERRIAAALPKFVPLAGSLPPAVAVRPRQLPRDETLVGRVPIMAEVTWRLAPKERDLPRPVIVIAGQPGIGKTALAVAAAHAVAEHYPDGQLHATLRSPTGAAEDSADIIAQLLRGLGEAAVPESMRERQARWRTLTADRRVLIVLDDAMSSRQVTDLLPANPLCGILVTARQRLPGVAGNQHEPPLETLPAEHARALFRQVVAAGRIALGPEDDEAVDRIVALCDGLPLALRIAAANRVHTPLRTTAQLADDLARQPLDEFEYEDLSVARSIKTSVDRLSDDGQRLLLSLGLTRLPTFSRWVAAVPETSAGRREGTRHEGTRRDEGLRELDALFMVDRAGETHYRFHDLTRIWAEKAARDRLGADADAVVAAVYRAMLTLVRRAHRAIYDDDFDVVHSTVPDWAQAPADILSEIAQGPDDWFESERLNIRAAVEHCAELGLVEICWDLAVSTHEFYTRHSHYDDWCATHAIALAACQQGPDPRGEGIIRTSLGQPALVASRHHAAVSGQPELELAIELLTKVGERHGLAIAQRTLANALRRHGHIARPLALFQEALEHFRQTRHRVGQWQALRFIGQTHLDLGQYEQALLTLRKAGRSAVTLGQQRLVAQSRYWIGQACLATGKLRSARAAFDYVWDIFRADTGVNHAYARHGLGDLAIRRDRLEEADKHLAAAIEAARSGPDTTLEGRAWLSVADLRRAQGRPRRQRKALQQARDVFHEHGPSYLEIRALAALATVAGQRTARQQWAEIENLYRLGGVTDDDRLYRPPVTRSSPAR